MNLNPDVECPVCRGCGEVDSPWSLEGPPTQGCFLCGGEGYLSQIKLDIYLKNEADMKEMADMQAFEDRISEPIDDSVDGGFNDN